MTEWWDDWAPPGTPMAAQGELGGALRAARYRAVLSQQEVAERAGVSQAVVSRMERGHRSSWPVFCRLLDAMGFEPVVTTRLRASDLDLEVERLADLTPEERVAEHQLFLEWLPQSLPQSLPQAMPQSMPESMPESVWAVDGDAALAAHGVPATPYRFLIAVLDDPGVQAELKRLREDRHAPFDFRLVATLPPLVHVQAGDVSVPLMPLDHIDLGEEGSQERSDREAALDAYVRRITGRRR